MAPADMDGTSFLVEPHTATSPCDGQGFSLSFSWVLPQHPPVETWERRAVGQDHTHPLSTGLGWSLLPVQCSLKTQDSFLFSHHWNNILPW